MSADEIVTQAAQLITGGDFAGAMGVLRVTSILTLTTQPVTTAGRKPLCLISRKWEPR